MGLAVPCQAIKFNHFITTSMPLCVDIYTRVIIDAPDISDMAIFLLTQCPLITLAFFLSQYFESKEFKADIRQTKD